MISTPLSHATRSMQPRPALSPGRSTPRVSPATRYIETVDLLLRAGAKPDTADDHGVTPLARACENTSVGVVEKLLEAGGDPNAAQTSGQTPLMIAARTGNVQVVKALLAHGANVNAVTTETTNSALMWAVAGRHPDVVRVLIEAQANVHVPTDKGF